MVNQIDIYDLGFADYRDVWDLQRRAQQLLIKQKKAIRESSALSYTERSVNDMLFFVEHPHVYTLGKSGDQANLLKGMAELAQIDAEFIEIDRGGDITYHGPGQIVGYPILDLDRHFTDIHKYLRTLEDVIIRTCADFDIEAGRIDGLTGVWAGNEKICAMGIRCSRWVTMHGFALNVNTDLSYFNHIVPCGISDKAVTSMQKLLDKEMDPNTVKKSIVKHLSELFEVSPKNKTLETEPELQISYL
ncbi:MAG TPA: lipoyl(octanoyl) transferase LipB [Balneolaceae bacterium]|nr:lipoyl(octanoyl) transferase LipB [Balneolaceae bacterium]